MASVGVRLVQGQLVIPNAMLTNLDALKKALLETPEVLDYIVKEDSRLASAIFAEGTDKLAEYLFEKMNRMENATKEEKEKDATVARTKYDARKKYPDLQREKERRSRLIVTVRVNGYPIKALIDTGAELSIATTKMIAQCHLESAVDSAYKGKVCGMGAQAIIGKVHSCKMQLGRTEFPLSLYIVEHQMSSPFLLGLDMLWRHAAIVDLRARVLRFGPEVAALELQQMRVTDRLCLPDSSEDVVAGSETDERNLPCTICRVRFDSRKALAEHERSAEHKRKVDEIVQRHKPKCVPAPAAGDGEPRKAPTGSDGEGD